MTKPEEDTLGPLATLAGRWQGDQGIDISYINDQQQQTAYREEITFEPLGPVKNGPQTLYGLRYSMTAWRLGEDDAFHEELGYWLWDAAQKQLLRCFMVPRGVLINAGGNAESDSTNFHLCAEVGSETYGILSNKFLDASHKTMKYSLNLNIHKNGQFSYKEETQLWIPANKAIFLHTDQNSLTKLE